MRRTQKDDCAFPADARTMTDGGMTMREYMATKAMQAICVNAGRNGFSFNKPDEIVKKAYEIADAMFLLQNQ